MRVPDTIDIGQCHPKIFLDAVPSGHWRTRNFRISPDRIGDGDLFDSCVAPPSRYLLEMYRRVSTMARDPRGRLFLLNPLPLLRRDETLLILAALRRIETEPAQDGLVLVLCDKANLPVAYLFPQSLIDDARFLILLSCSDAALDATALGMLYSCGSETRCLDISVSLANCNGFYGGKYLRPNEICCRNAIDVLQACWTTTGAAGDQARRACRDSIPLFAFVSHHAGDVLFATLAARSTAAMFQGLAIHRDYSAICRQAGLPVALLEFEGPVAHRGGYRHDDPEQFVDVFPTLPSDRFYVYARTSRDYNVSDHHLIDHYAFVLGAPLATPTEIDDGQPLVAAPAEPDSASSETRSDRKILLHFDAGWPLKIYPRQWQTALVELLLQHGYALTLLDGTGDVSGCRRERFESLAQFEWLLAEHDLLIGMDSFPAHYASLVRQTPTLCLFSSTHPVHSRTRQSPRYQWLSAQLDCTPCRAYQVCPRFGGELCRNFLPPDEVWRHVEALLATSRAPVATGPAAALPASNHLLPLTPAFKHLPSSQLPQRLRAGRSTVSIDPLHMNYSWRRRHYRAMRVLRSVLQALGLIREYFFAVRDQGFWRANALTRDYLSRFFGGTEKPDGR